MAWLAVHCDVSKNFSRLHSSATRLVNISFRLLYNVPSPAISGRNHVFLFFPPSPESYINDYDRRYSRENPRIIHYYVTFRGSYTGTSSSHETLPEQLGNEVWLCRIVFYRGRKWSPTVLSRNLTKMLAYARPLDLGGAPSSLHLVQEWSCSASHPACAVNEVRNAMALRCWWPVTTAGTPSAPGKSYIVTFIPTPPFLPFARDLLFPEKFFLRIPLAQYCQARRYRYTVNRYICLTLRYIVKKLPEISRVMIESSWDVESRLELHMQGMSKGRSDIFYLFKPRRNPKNRDFWRTRDVTQIGFLWRILAMDGVMVILLRRRTWSTGRRSLLRGRTQQRYLSLFTNRIDKSLSVGLSTDSIRLSDPFVLRNARCGSLSCRNPRGKGHCILQLVVHELMHEEDVAWRHLLSL